MTFMVILQAKKVYTFFKSLFLTVGFTNGSVRILDGLMLKEEGHGDGFAVFNHCHGCVTNIKFSHDSSYLATSVSEGLIGKKSSFVKRIKK